MKLSFKNIGHYFAVAGHAMAKAADFFVRSAPAIQQLNSLAEVGERIAGVPPAVIDFQDAAAGAYGHVAQVLSTSPKNPDGSLNLGTLQPELVAAVESTMKTVDAFAAIQGIPKPAAPPVQTSPAMPAVTVVK